MKVISSDFDHLGSVLGTPTAQKLVMLLITWDTLSLQDLITKSGFSKSQVYSTLKNLIHLDIVNSPSRGIYKNSDSQFAKLLKEAYLAKLHGDYCTDKY